MVVVILIAFCILLLVIIYAQSEIVVITSMMLLILLLLWTKYFKGESKSKSSDKNKIQQIEKQTQTEQWAAIGKKIGKASIKKKQRFRKHQF